VRKWNEYKDEIRYLFILAIVILFTSCAGIRDKAPSGLNTAAIQIKSTGINKKEKSLVLYFVQYSVDGKLIQAHQMRENFDRTIKLVPGVHSLFVEYAHRGMLSARAILQKEGECYIFTVGDGQTVLFEGEALSRDKWQALGFQDVETSQKKCNLEECKKFLIVKKREQGGSLP
jgi:hypothetical protein